MERFRHPASNDQCADLDESRAGVERDQSQAREPEQTGETAVEGLGRAVPIRDLLKGESGVFGPDELRHIAAAFDAARQCLGLTDREDPVTLMLAKLTIEMAKQGQFTAASLRERVLKEMKPKGRLN